MATGNKNLILSEVRGRIGNFLVLKQYRTGTVISVMPDMSKVKKSRLQKQKQNNFADAIVYAQGILRDQKKKVEYARKLPKGKSVYHAAIQEYLKKNKK